MFWMNAAAEIYSIYPATNPPPNPPSFLQMAGSNFQVKLQGFQMPRQSRPHVWLRMQEIQRSFLSQTWGFWVNFLTPKSREYISQNRSWHLWHMSILMNDRDSHKISFWYPPTLWKSKHWGIPTATVYISFKHLKLRPCCLWSSWIRYQPEKPPETSQ